MNRLDRQMMIIGADMDNKQKPTLEIGVDNNLNNQQLTFNIKSSRPRWLARWIWMTPLKTNNQTR
jgi:hypothetical protein